MTVFNDLFTDLTTDEDLSEVVNYYDGTETVEDINAVKGDCPHEIETANGVLIPAGDVTFIIKKSDLENAAEETITPAHGHKITTTSETFDVVQAIEDSSGAGWEIDATRR